MTSFYLPASLVTLFIFAWISPASAQRHNPVKVLDYSLETLRQSAQEVFQKNEWLQFENQKLIQAIEDSRKELSALEAASQNAIIEIERQSAAMEMNASPWQMQRAEMLYQELARLEQEHKELLQRLQDKEQAKAQTMSDVKSMEDANHRLSIKIDELKAKMKPDQMSRTQIQLFQSLKMSDNNLKMAHNHLDDLQRKHGKPLKMFEQLKQDNAELKQALALKEDEYRIVKEKGIKINKDIKEIQEFNKAKIVKWNEDIETLKIRKKDLLQTLAKVNKHFSPGQLQPDFSQEIVRFETNLKVIKEQNQLLAEEIASRGEASP